MPPSAAGRKPKYDITISDGTATLGLMVSGNALSAIRQLPRGPGVERKLAKQKDWSGGRGLERFGADTSRFYDSGAVWSMVPGQALNGPLMRPSRTPYRQHRLFWPWANSTIAAYTGYQWQALTGSQRFIGADLTISGGEWGAALPFTMRRATVIVRKVGTPASALQVAICNDNTNQPGTVIQSVTLAVASVTDWLAVTFEAAFGSDITVGSGTRNWIRVGDNGGTGDASNHWEVLGAHDSALAFFKSSDGTTWDTSGTFTLYWRIYPEPTTKQRRVFFFEYKRALYAAVAVPGAGGSAAVYRNGDRGVATGAQDTTHLTDSTKAWGDNEWQGAVALFTSGGLRGEARAIVSNTSTQLNFGSDSLPSAPTTGASGSEYVILGSDEWSAVSTVTLNDNPTDVAVLNDTVYLTGGDGANITRFREFNNAGTWTVQEADDGANKAALIEAFQEGNKTYLYRVNNDTVQFSRAPSVAWGTNLTFETAAPVGDTNAIATGLTVYDDAVHISKEDSIYVVKNAIATKVPVPIDTARDLVNGTVLRGWNTQLYFNFLDGFERMYGRTIDDIGPNRDQGMPPTRRGTVADFQAVLQYGFIAWNGGEASSYLSAILATPSPGGSWHELFRMPSANLTIQSLAYQSIPILPNRLWFQGGHDVAYLTMPNTAQNPLNDSDMRYTWEGYLTTAWIDLDTIELDHFWDELRLFTRHLSSGTPPALVEVDYQTDAASDASAWTRFTSAYNTSPVQMLAVGNTSVTGRRLRLRLRLLPGSTTTPVVINELELRANQLNEVLYDYVLDVRWGDRMMLWHGGEARAASEQAGAILAQLNAWKGNAAPLTLRTRHPLIDNVRGHLDPVALTPASWDPDEQALAGSLTFRET